MKDVEGFRAWLERTNRSGNTIRMYVSRINDLDNSGLESTEWLSRAKSNGLSASSIKTMFAAVNSYNKYAKITDDELSEFRVPRQAEPSPHPLPGGINDVRKALNYAYTPSHRIAIALGGFAGCRVDESISLTCNDIKSGFLVIKGKGEKFRKVPISEELYRELSMVDTERLVPLCNASARKAITAVFKRAGIKGKDDKPVSSHDLRATFATEVYNNTNNILKVQRLLGHSSVITTQRYLGIDDQAMIEAVNF